MKTPPKSPKSTKSTKPPKSTKSFPIFRRLQLTRAQIENLLGTPPASSVLPSVPVPACPWPSRQTSQELQIECLRRAIIKTEQALQRNTAAQIAIILRRHRQTTELTTQLAIAASRKAKG